MKKTKCVYYMFRLRSNRGTDICRCLELTSGLSKEDVRDIMKNYADRLTAYTGCREHEVSYGRVRLLPRRLLLKKYRSICASKEKLNTKWMELSSMLNPFPLIG